MSLNDEQAPDDGNPTPQATTRREQRDAEHASTTRRRAWMGAAALAAAAVGTGAAVALNGRTPPPRTAAHDQSTLLNGEPATITNIGADGTSLPGPRRALAVRPESESSPDPSADPAGGGSGGSGSGGSGSGSTMTGASGGSSLAVQQPSTTGGPGTSSESYVAAAQTPQLAPGRQYSGFTEAAQAAAPAGSVFDPELAQAHLLRRATFGARPAEAADLQSRGIDAWLSDQLTPASIADPEGDAAWAAFPLAGANPATIFSSTKRYSWDGMMDAARGALGRQIFSSRQLQEVVVDTLASHLHVPMPSEVWDSGPDYHTAVIRAHAMGKYRDMLLAAMRHPAMLRFLDNHVSTKNSVNENLGRELLELHTVGIAGGYTEDDVRNSAYILTGRGLSADGGSQFVYRADRHYVGPVKVLGFEHANDSAEGGLEVGDAYINYLAEQPSTARFLARVLAVRFVADNPSEDLIERLTQAYLTNDTSIHHMLLELFRSTDFWSGHGTKMRRPLEDAVGSARVLDVQRGAELAKGINQLYWRLHQSGHAPLRWEAPDGFPDVAGAWLNTGDVVGRWNLHRMFVDGRIKGLDGVASADIVPAQDYSTVREWIDAIATRVVGQPLSPEHTDALLAFVGVDGEAAAADSADQARHLLSLVLDSPYFQLR